MLRNPLTVLGAALCLGLLCGCGRGDGPPAAPTERGAANLQSLDLKSGSGDAIKPGQTAVVNYTGWLYEAAATDHKGKQFDSSIDAGKPFKFILGTGQVVKGWDQGVAGMQVGGRRRLTIPPDLGYGDQGAGGVIPGGATLIFEIDLIGIE